MRFHFQMRPDNHGRFVVRYKDLLSEVPRAHIPRIDEWGKLSSLPAAALVRRGRTAVLQPGHAMLCALSWTAASAALSTDSSGLAASLRVQNQAGQWQATLELFRAAKAGGADRSSYTEAIVAHGRLRQSDKALNVFREMQDAGLTPNVVSCAQRAWGPLPHCQLSLTPRPHHASCAQTRPRSPRAGARATGRSRSRSSQTCKRTVSRPTPTPSTRSAASRAHSRLCPPPPS
jgi:pentatricopeptide repeat protein